MLTIAYGSSIGGMATVIGTPPNLFMRGYFADKLDINISFFYWMLWATPIAIVILIVTYFLLAFVLFPCSQLSLTRAEQVFQAEREKLGPMKPVHWRMVAVFFVTTSLWIFRGLIQPYLPILPLTGVYTSDAAFTDSTTAHAVPASTWSPTFGRST